MEHRAHSEGMMIFMGFNLLRLATYSDNIGVEGEDITAGMAEIVRLISVDWDDVT